MGAIVAITETITATELAAVLAKDTAAIYRLANRKGWRRTHTRPVRYVITDVMDTMAEPARGS